MSPLPSPAKILEKSPLVPPVLRGIREERGYLLQTISATVLLLALLVAPAFAHKVQIAEDVGSTLHIEPNDNPKAGEPALAWFALARKGGKAIPLRECNCKLAVYSQPRTQDASPVLSPPLKAMSVEGYQGIPGADIVFPKPGAYQVQLSGTPASGAKFKPFSLTYTVTVAGGKSAATATEEATQTTHTPHTTQNASVSSERWQIPVIALATILGIGIAWGISRRLK